MSDPVWISGGTGLVGGRLVASLADRSLRLVSRSARPGAAAPGAEVVGWDGTRVPPASLDGVGALVHLSGEPIFGGLPTAARKRRMWDSRVDSTRSLVDAVGALPSSQRPRVLVCASAVGVYGDRGEETLTEDAPPGTGFLAELCVAWEAEAARARELGLRVVSLRLGVVLSREGGALGPLLPLFRLGLGGPLGDGRQWFPWIHREDAAGLLRFALERDDATGPWNGTAPEPARNADFTRALGRAVGRPTWLRVPGLAVRAGLGEISGELLGSRRVDPSRARQAGYRWAEPDLDAALAREARRD